MIFPTFLQAQDWPNLARYKDENAKTGLPAANENRVVFMGNSITESWGQISPEFFQENHTSIAASVDKRHPRCSSGSGLMLLLLSRLSL